MVYRGARIAAAVSLGVLCCAGIVGAVVCVVYDKPVPQPLWTIIAACAGALVTLAKIEGRKGE